MERRRQLLRIWRITGPILLLALSIAGIFMFINYPLMFNPYVLIERLESGALDEATVHIMALLLPVVMLMVFFMLVIVVLLVFASISNDKKYLAIIDRMCDENSGRSG